MRRKTTQFEAGKGEMGGVERGAGGGGSPSSSLMGSQWPKGTRPTEMPKGKVELRELQRAAKPSTSKPRETYEEYMARHKAARKTSFRKGGMVCREYGK